MFRTRSRPWVGWEVDDRTTRMTLESVSPYSPVPTYDSEDAPPEGLTGDLSVLSR